MPPLVLGEHTSLSRGADAVLADAGPAANAISPSKLTTKAAIALNIEALLAFRCLRWNPSTPPDPVAAPRENEDYAPVSGPTSEVTSGISLLRPVHEDF